MTEVRNRMLAPRKGRTERIVSRLPARPPSTSGVLQNGGGRNLRNQRRKNPRPQRRAQALFLDASSEIFVQRVEAVRLQSPEDPTQPLCYKVHGMKASSTIYPPQPAEERPGTPK